MSELPGRAKYIVRKYDILISKLKGNISFTIITHDIDNLIVSNGFTVIRPKNYESSLILFSNLFTNEFRIQHQSLVTGSIMETILDNDVYDIYIDPNIVTDQKYISILNSLSILNDIY